LSEGIADGVFRIETIPRVGHRLELEQGVVGARTIKRRQIAFISLAAMIAVAGLLWVLLLRPDPARMTVQLAKFERLGSDVPPETTAVFRRELRNAFGEANAVEINDRGGTYLLGGSVQRVGGNDRYSVQLTDPASGEMLWTGSRDMPAAEAALASKQLANGISWVVRCGLADAMEYPGRLEPRTLSLYLQRCGITMWDENGTPERALDVMRKVVAQAPDFSKAWSGLAIDAALVARKSPPAKTIALRMEGTKAVERALKLDPKNGQAYLAAAELQPGTAWRKRELLHRRSVELRESDCGCEHENYGHFLLSVGRPSQAAVEFGRGQDFQPNSPSAMDGLAVAYFGKGDLARADQVLDDREAVWGRSPQLRTLRLRQAIGTGAWAEAAKLAPGAISDDASRGPITAALASLASRDLSAMASAAARVEALDSEPTAELQAYLLAALGRKQNALKLLETLVGRQGAEASAFLLDPAFKSLRGEPRYIALLQRLGLVQYWREGRQPPEMCSSPDAPKFCGAFK
jgi:Flp pilus assembly protein TadD